MANKHMGRALQFSLRGLVLAIVALSVLFALLFDAPDWVATLTVLAMMPLTLAGLVGAIIYGRGDARAFCIGALFPAAVFAIPLIYLFVFVSPGMFMGEWGDWSDDLSQLSAVMTGHLLTGFVLSLISGTMTVAIRRFLSQEQ